MRIASIAVLSIYLSRPGFLPGQQPLSLTEAVELAVRQNKSLESVRAQVKAAKAHLQVARAGYYPTLNYSESATRSNNPVFVFSSLLIEHQFTTANFEIGRLNRPGGLDNFRSSLLAEQTIFDAGQTRNAIRASHALEQVATSEVHRTESEVTFNTIRAYLDAVLSATARQAATQAVRSAEADLKRARNIHQAGMSTEADVLSIRVHLARMREQEIRRTAELATARATLNDALGLSLDAEHELTTQLSKPVQPSTDALAAYEKSAAENRPEELRMQYSEQLASTQLARERSTMLPTVSVAAILEADRETFVTRGGANYTVAATLNWNIFNGFRDKAQIEELRQQLVSAKALRERMSSAVRLEVRRAWEDLQAANQRIAVSQATVAQAEESLRITQNRYQAGLSQVTELLRTEAAVLESRTEYLSALHDQRLAAAELDAAAGTLTLASPSLKD